MVDRFRLVYLKSPEIEATDFDPSFSSNGDQEIEKGFIDRFSSETILKHAKADLRHPDSKIRLLAVTYYLGKTYPLIPMGLLQEILSDKDPEVRAQVLRSLIKFRSPFLSSLLKKYLRDKDPKVRIAALRGIFQYQDQLDMNLLLQFLSDESSWVRRKVATLLGWKPIEGSFPFLMEMSRDQDSMVRKAALTSLMTLYPEESEERLLEAISDPDPGMRNWARRTFENLTHLPLKRKKDFQID